MPLRFSGYEDLVAGLGDSSWVVITDHRLRVRFASGRRPEDPAWSAADWIGCDLPGLMPEAAWAELGPRFDRALCGEQQAFDHWTADRRRAYWIHIVPVSGEAGPAGSLVVIAFDATARLRTAARLRRTHERLDGSEQIAGVGSWELSLADGMITYSSGFGRIFGLAPGVPIELDRYEQLVHEEDREVLRSAIAECVRNGTVSCEYRLAPVVGRAPGGGAAPGGGPVRTLAVRGEHVAFGDGSPGYLRGSVLDVTHEREAERERLAAMGLFEQAFDASPIGMALSDPETGAFTRVNDALCTMFGRSREDLLRMRVGEVTHPADRWKTAGAVRDMVSGVSEKHLCEKRYLKADGTVVWASVHIVPVRNADGTVAALFAQKIDVTERKRRETQLVRYMDDAQRLARIREAIDEDLLTLHWQPIVDLGTGATVARELLLRMRSPEGTLVMPGDFLPVAERYGLICEIDRWVIREAARLAGDGVPTEFNLSAASVGNPDVLGELARALDENDLDPRLLIVEVTETAMMNQPDDGQRFAEAIRALGCGLALDDFGTGYASLSYLKHLAADHLKIDIEFVRDLDQNEASVRLIRGIVGLAGEFGLCTVAEGVEDEQTLSRLRELGVQRAQGYHFARPLPFGDVPVPVRRNPARRLRTKLGMSAVEAAKAAFDAFDRLDATAAQALCHPDVVLRVLSTVGRSAVRGGYRTHAGVCDYFEDVRLAWDRVRLLPAAWWEMQDAVIAVGEAVTSIDGANDTTDMLWVIRFRDGLIGSVDAFRRPSLPPGGDQLPDRPGLPLEPAAV